MKAITLCLLVHFLSWQLYSQATDTLSTPPSDTTIAPSTWQVRAPRSDEELRRREANREELEAMKQRFQAYQTEESNRELNTTDEDYLWSEAAVGGKQEASTTSPSLPDTAALRMEISRNLWHGQPTRTTTSPDGNEPIPSSYDVPSAPAWEDELKQTSAPRTPQQTDWATRIVAEKIEEDDTPHSDLPLLEAGKTWVLKEISFLPNTYQLTPDGIAALDKWGQWFSSHQGIQLEIRSHTAATADVLGAKELSQHRAQAIADYWTSKGLNAQQLSAKGMGSISPLVSTQDPLHLEKNERIEVIILELPNR
ncbi:MAG: OmpA family protein [Saprospiraceae bacterium]